MDTLHTSNILKFSFSRILHQHSPVPLSSHISSTVSTSPYSWMTPYPWCYRPLSWFSPTAHLPWWSSRRRDFPTPTRISPLPHCQLQEDQQWDRLFLQNGLVHTISDSLCSWSQTDIMEIRWFKEASVECQEVVGGAGGVARELIS